ncbi:MAG: hypothetical protein M1840_002172 [Geoglossum simile]|nr:MAG: hypothetical protein M1840_002172 [Geoglossum simile]
MGEGEWTVVTPRSHRKPQRRTSTPINSGTSERSTKPKAGTRELFLKASRHSREPSRSRSQSKSPSHPLTSSLLSQYYDANQWIDALTSGSEERVRVCLEQGADINSTQPCKPRGGKQSKETFGTPLEIAAAEGWRGVVDLLLKGGADRSQYALALRAVSGKMSLARRLDTAEARKKVGRYRAVSDLIRLWAFSYQKSEAAYPNLRALVKCSQARAVPDVVTCQWEIPAVVKAAQAELDGKFDPGVLRRLVVLTGLEGEYEATTCEQYLGREWGDVGIGVLDWIIYSLDSVVEMTWKKPYTQVAILLKQPKHERLTRAKPHQASNKRPPASFICRLTASSTFAEVHCKGNLTLEKRYAVIDALTWVCEAARLPTSAGVGFRAATSTSSCRLLRSEDAGRRSDVGEGQGLSHHAPRKLGLKIEFMLEPLTPLKSAGSQCWLPLFRRCVISARRARERPSGFGRGLEASFERLAELAAVEIRVPVDGGCVFLGYQTILVPYDFKSFPSGDNYLQFHLEYSRKGGQGQINPFHPKARRSNPILRNDEYEIGADTRCFLGWCPCGQINLGTKAMLKNPIYSFTEAKDRTLHLKGLSVGAQAGPSGLLQGGLICQMTGEYVSNLLRFRPHISYPKMLNNTSKEVAVVIDNTTHRSWMVPKLSLLLHMAHCWVSSGTPGLIRPGSIPYVDPHYDGNQVAERLITHGDNIVCGVAGTEDVVTLRTLLLGLNVNLIDSRQLTEPAREASVFQDGHVFAFEFLDLVREPGRGTSMRKVPVGDSGWLRICHNADAVVVCGDLGDAITPAPAAAGWSPACNTLPPGQHYLAAPVSCLRLIIEGSGGSKSTRMCLELRSNPFVTCVHDEKRRETCWEKKELFQGIVKAARSRRRETNGVGSGLFANLPEEGVLVFGKRMRGRP